MTIPKERVQPWEQAWKSRENRLIRRIQNPPPSLCIRRGDYILIPRDAFHKNHVGDLGYYKDNHAHRSLCGKTSVVDPDKSPVFVAGTPGGDRSICQHCVIQWRKRYGV